MHMLGTHIQISNFNWKLSNFLSYYKQYGWYLPVLYRNNYSLFMHVDFLVSNVYLDTAHSSIANMYILLNTPFTGKRPL